MIPQVFILSGKYNRQEKYNLYYEECFKTYEDVWLDAFQELEKNISTLYSDEFTRQDIIVGIYDLENNKCAAFIAYRFIEINNINFRDSWFENFTLKHKNFFYTRGSKKAVIASLLSVKKEYRKNLQQIHFAKEIVSCGMLEICNYEWDYIITQSRNCRKINIIAKSVGGIVLANNVPKYNSFSDIIYFTHESIIKASRKFDSLTQHLYDERIDLQAHLN